MSKLLKLDDIRMDGETQVRVQIDEKAVLDYAESMLEGAKFPAITVYHDGSDYWLADGFHRLHATRSAGFADVACEIRKGTRLDAVWHALGANKGHGLRMQAQDKRRAIELALKAFPERTQQQIAAQVGCSQQYVGRVQAQLTTSCKLPDRRAGADGKERPTTYKPRRPPPAVPPTEPVPDNHAPDYELEKVEAPDSGPVDGLGREVPEHLAELWDQRHVVKGVLRDISDLRCRFQALQEQHAEGVWARLNYSSLLAHLNQAYADIAACEPFCVCPMCSGRGCRACASTGLLSKFFYNTVVPAEFKA